ncbi:MAG: GNAT family N-acetyltransferase [Dehalococcoidia bacterium]|nr:GNAT family N-acetyltransferase [Dehalococcoidia bacterium]
MSSDWTIRLATPDDGQAIVDLFRSVGWKFEMSHWKWKYLDNPTGKRCIFVAQDNGRIVGHYAAVPTYMNFKGQKVLGAQRTDAAVDAMYRGKGMFGALYRESCSAAASHGIQFLYGTPNEMSYGRLVKLGTCDSPGLPRLEKVLDAKAVIKMTTGSAKMAAAADKPAHVFLKLCKGDRKPESVGHLKVSRVAALDERFDDLWLKAKDDSRVSVWKDSSYLKWRYLACPDREYAVLTAEEQGNLIGFAVLRCVSEELRRGYVVDFLVLPGRSAAALLLISAALDHFREQGMHMAICHLFEHSPIYRLFRNQGFFKHGTNHFTTRPLELGTTQAVSDYRQWHLMGGDFDVF